MAADPSSTKLVVVAVLQLCLLGITAAAICFGSRESEDQKTGSQLCSNLWRLSFFFFFFVFFFFFKTYKYHWIKCENALLFLNWRFVFPFFVKNFLRKTKKRVMSFKKISSAGLWYNECKCCFKKNVNYFWLELKVELNSSSFFFKKLWEPLLGFFLHHCMYKCFWETKQKTLLNIWQFYQWYPETQSTKVKVEKTTTSL